MFGLKNHRKAICPDFIPVKVIKFASIVIDSHLYNTTIRPRKKNKYSEKSKTALVRPIFKKYERKTTGNYRPVNIVNGMFKSHERCIQDSVSPYAERMLSNFMSAYKKSYSSNHVLLRLIANWEKS